MKIGIISFYFNKYGVREGAKRMREHGYDCVDYQGFVNTETDFFGLGEREFERTLTEQRKMIESEGITVNQVHGPWRYPPRDLEAQDRADRFASMSKSIRGASYLGCDKMVVHPLMPYGADSDENPEKMREINYEFFARLAEVGKEYGVVVCYENMPFRKLPITSYKDVCDTVRMIDSKYFKVCLDVGHCLTLSHSPADAVRYIGKDLYAMHVHDNDGTADQHLIPGQGIGDFRELTRALYEIGYEGVYSLETHIKADSVEEQLRREYELAALAKILVQTN